MRPMVYLVVVGASLALLSASCGAGAAGSGSASEAADVADLTTAMERSLLTLDDLPSGWTAQPPTDEDDDDSLDLPENCRTFDNYDEIPGIVAEVEAEEFAEPRQEQLRSGLAAVDDSDPARSALERLDEVLGDCREIIMNALSTSLNEDFRESAVDSPFAAVEVKDLDIHRLSFPDARQQLFTFRATAELDFGLFDLTVVTDFVSARVSNFVAWLVSGVVDTPPDLEEEARLLGLMLCRIQAELSMPKDASAC